MAPSPDPNMIPWELIAGNLRKSLSPEDLQALDTWLGTSQANRDVYAEIVSLWERGIEGYSWYRQADPARDWAGLQQKIAARTALPEKGRLIRPAFYRTRLFRAVAAVVILTLGAAALRNWLGNRPVVYESGSKANRELHLADGSLITLRPGSRIRLEKDFGEHNRTVYLDEGSAYFDVLHRQAWPFIVRLPAAQIVDIGTRFIVTRGIDSVLVSVLTGKVAFLGGSDSTRHEVGEGVELLFHPASGRFDNPVLTGWVADSSRNRLRFVNRPLPEVIGMLQEISGRTILLKDTSLLHYRLTARLDGESFDNAIGIICGSLDIRSKTSNDTCYLFLKANQ